MNRLRFLSGKGVIAMAAIILFAAGAASAADSLEKCGLYRAFQRNWKDVELGRDFEYWRAPEMTPGTLLCAKPAATDVWVSCDRWPDASDVRRFGLDAIRLSGAKTEHEKATAVYRWVRRWMIFTGNGKGAPAERLTPRLGNNPCVHEPAKLLNVYGAHWCGGQARVVELIWRALGFRAEKVAVGGHTIVGMHYRDDDGVQRWHTLDVSHSHVVWDKSLRRLLGVNERPARDGGGHYYGLPGNGHLYTNNHRMEMAFRPGEKLERIWGNWGKPYQDNAARKNNRMAKKVPSYERGPYPPFVFGNGRWTYSPDLTNPRWIKGLVSPPTGMADGALQPAKAGKPAAAVWHFSTPYIVSDAEVKMTIKRKSAKDIIRLHVSVDNGKTWKQMWQCPDDVTGEKEVSASICPKFDVGQKVEPPEGFHSPFGHYAYQVKVELLGKDKPEDCSVKAISFETFVQLNILSLPQLQPGRNRITVRGKPAEGTALKVTYVWDDPKGKGRTNVTIVENAPYTYEILAAGKKWADCVCKSMTVESVAATGQGNRTIVKEKPSEIHELSPMPPFAETTGGWPAGGKWPKVERVATRLKAKVKLKHALPAAARIGDPSFFDILKPMLYDPAMARHRKAIVVALYNSNPERARPLLLDILNNMDTLKWPPFKGKRDPAGTHHWVETGAVIGYMACESGWKEFLPGLAKLLENPWASAKWGPRYGIVRSIGRLGKDDKCASTVMEKVLTNKLYKEHGDTLIVAALAAGRIGDPALIPALRKYVSQDYWPLKHNAALSLGILGDESIVPRMHEWLAVKWDENYRAYAAEALGSLKDKGSATALKAALAVEPFPWVRAKIEEALQKIGHGSTRLPRRGQTPFPKAKKGTDPAPSRTMPKNEGTR